VGRRRKTDKPGDSGSYEGLTPEQKGRAFDGMFGRSKVRAADKQLKGKAPYEADAKVTKKRFGRKS
jgi:hypothetical protein